MSEHRNVETAEPDGEDVRETGRRSRGRDEPEQPTDLPKPAWGGVFKRTLREFSDDNLTDLAAALTYYGVLAIFPMLLVIVSVLGLIGPSVP